MGAYEEILAANERYAGAFAKGELPPQPERRFAVVTCMDARLDPARFLGLEEGDAHVLRTAGATVTDDVLRSLTLSHHLLGTTEAFVIGHEACGQLGLTNERVVELAGEAAAGLDFLGIADLDESVRASVRRVREWPLLPASFGVRGLVYDPASGRLREVD